uniref:uncharacterized protein LOC122585928 isoform X2 n=1 Tax=Erigeron canadensis TaxID=72917 RepID=UPI001CB90E4E|nr:uncharacterized protein LOC122585928 isoform X2 [Erigeron canadensis]
MYPKVKVKQQQEEEELQDHHHPSEEEFQRIFLKDFKSMSTSLYHHHHPSNSNSNPNPNPNPKSPPEHKHGYTPPHVRVPISGANKKISSTSSSRSKVVNKNIITGDEVTNYTEKPPSSVLPAPRAVLSSPENDAMLGAKKITKTLLHPNTRNRCNQLHDRSKTKSSWK